VQLPALVDPAPLKTAPRTDNMLKIPLRRMTNGILRHIPETLHDPVARRACARINQWHQSRRLALSDPVRSVLLLRCTKQVNSSWRIAFYVIATTQKAAHSLQCAGSASSNPHQSLAANASPQHSNAARLPGRK
jgi:hypothetical protein